MKKYILYSIVFALFAVGVSCEKGSIEDRGIYITAADESPLTSVTVDDKGGVLGITTSSYAITDKDISIEYVTDAALVDTYNEKHNTQYKMLPSKFFSLSKQSAIIKAGTSLSEGVELTINPFDASIEEGVQYLVPIALKSTSTDIPVIEDSKVLYVAINRVLISSALDAGSVTRFAMPDPIKDLTEFTVEMRVRKTTPFVGTAPLFQAYPSEIFTRFGDVVIKPNQLQIKYAGIQPASVTEFQVNKWYHIAFVLESATGSFKLYVDGKLDGNTPAPAGAKFNLDNMAFWTGSQVQEVRFWTKARTDLEIRSNMCAVSPSSDGLYGYWKFNDGSGNKVTDVTGKGHDGTIEGTAKWIAGVRCPE